MITSDVRLEVAHWRSDVSIAGDTSLLIDGLAIDRRHVAGISARRNASKVLNRLGA